MWKAVFLLIAAVSTAQSLRPPAIPLVSISPSVSIWARGDGVAGQDTTHWSGKPMRLRAALLVDGKPFSIMGDPASFANGSVEMVNQTEVVVAATTTTSKSVAGPVTVELKFTTPAVLPDDELTQLPVTFISAKVLSRDGKMHAVSLYVDIAAEITVNNGTVEEVSWNAFNSSTWDGVRVGSTKQDIFGLRGDGTTINWGYLYSLISKNQSASYTFSEAKETLDSFLHSRPLPPILNSSSLNASDGGILVTAFLWNTHQVSAVDEFSVSFGMVYDDVESIEYFGKGLKPLWTQAFGTTEDLIEHIGVHQKDILQRAQEFDSNVAAELEYEMGFDMAQVCQLAFRQVSGAIKLTRASDDGSTWAFMKEISSDGDVSTVDVVFPASPILLVYNPVLLYQIIEPMLDYANNSTDIKYNLPWAPHHLGTWPICDLTPEKQEQMPMEESGNLLILLDAILSRLNATEEEAVLQRLRNYSNLLGIWAGYLKTSLPDPGNQLCTDDFEGPSPHNSNLAAKGIIGLAAYADIKRRMGALKDYNEFTADAHAFVTQWLNMSMDYKHTNREYDLPGTWSQKYNIFFDRVLKFNLFPESFYATEADYYRTLLHKYGLPLDDRATFTKLDWSAWTAATFDSLADDINSRILDFVNGTPDRIPLTDCYNTDDSTQKYFMARPVVGALYAKLLLD